MFENQFPDILAYAHVWCVWLVSWWLCAVRMTYVLRNTASNKLLHRQLPDVRSIVDWCLCHFVWTTACALRTAWTQFVHDGVLFVRSHADNSGCRDTIRNTIERNLDGMASSKHVPGTAPDNWQCRSIQMLSCILVRQTMHLEELLAVPLCKLVQPAGTTAL